MSLRSVLQRQSYRMVGLRIASALLLSLCLTKTLVAAPPSEGKEIADRLGDDLSFASKQLIRGFTAIFAPIIDTVQRTPNGFAKIIPIPIGGGNDPGVSQAAENFRRVLLRDGVNAIGKGVKAGATIISTPARVAGTGLEEARKVGEAAGIDSRMGGVESKKSGVSAGNVRSGIEDGTKIASTLLNTTASEFSQANLGAVLVEVALKNRIKDIGNKTATAVQSMAGPKIEMKQINKRADPEGTSNNEEQTPAPSRVDDLLERFNEAIRQNDERITNALRSILAQINPPKN